MLLNNHLKYHFQRVKYYFLTRIKIGLDKLRSALSDYPNDDEILNSANHLKFNRMKKCVLNIDDKLKVSTFIGIHTFNDYGIENGMNAMSLKDEEQDMFINKEQNKYNDLVKQNYKILITKNTISNLGSATNIMLNENFK